MKQILIIEDEYDNCKLISDILKAEGYRVLAAADGRTGIELAIDYLPDLIISDVNMPDVDGYRVLTALRKNPATMSIPFIFLSALGAEQDIRSGMGLGADDYLTKPFYIKDLLTAVRVRLEKQERIARETEERLNELRRSIAHALPHEFRTPLSIVMGFSSLLAEDAPPEQAEMLQSILRSANRLNQLTEKFWTYVETEIVAASPISREPLRDQRVDHVRDVIICSASETAQDADRGDELALSVEDASVQIAEHHLRQIITEITQNAFKFSEPGTPVEITAGLSEKKYVIGITDRGRGMTAEQIARIGAYIQFEREHYEQKGVGLGLTISRRLAELYGGHLDIGSVPNQGTIVTICLPLAQ